MQGESPEADPPDLCSGVLAPRVGAQGASVVQTSRLGQLDCRAPLQLKPGQVPPLSYPAPQPSQPWWTADPSPPHLARPRKGEPLDPTSGLCRRSPSTAKHGFPRPRGARAFAPFIPSHSAPVQGTGVPLPCRADAASLGPGLPGKPQPSAVTSRDVCRAQN